MKLQGGINFRDMGGSATHDGRRLKQGHFYRSGSLSGLTAEDCRQLEALSIHHIIDYRDLKESQGDKDVLWAGVHYECVPANPPSHSSNNVGDEFFSNKVLEAMPRNFMESLYSQLPFSNVAYRALFHRTENLQQGALVHHCAVGKDRTGVGSALLLLSLGATKEAVLEDYLVTQETLHPYRTAIFEKIESKLSAKSAETFHYVMGVSESFLDSALSEIEKRYGNFERYFATEFGLTPEKRADLQSRYLE